MIRAGARTAHSQIKKFINYVWNKEELPQQLRQSLYFFIRKVIKQTVIVIQVNHCYQLCTAFHAALFCQGKLHMQTELMGIINVDLNC